MKSKGSGPFLVMPISFLVYILDRMQNIVGEPIIGHCP